MKGEKSSELISLGQNIRNIRKDKRLSLTQLAQLTGVSTSALSTIETASRDPRASTLFRIAKALRVPIADLFGVAKNTLPRKPSSSGYDLGDLE